MPKKNGESNDIRTPVGSLLFEINGADTQELIAVKVEDKFFKASKFGSIQFIIFPIGLRNNYGFKHCQSVCWSF